MKSNVALSERIHTLFEDQMVFLNPNVKLRDVAKVLNEENAVVKNCFDQTIGYSLEEMLSIYRVAHARHLLVKKSYPFRELWRVSGFKSHKDLKMNFEKVVI